MKGGWSPAGHLAEATLRGRLVSQAFDSGDPLLGEGRGCSGLDARARGVWDILMVNLKHAVGPAIALLAYVVPTNGAALRTLAQYPQSLAIAENPMYSNAAAVTRVIQRPGQPAITETASAVAIAPDLFIHSGHFNPAPGSTIARLTHLTFGANYNTSTDRHTITEWQDFPGYIFGDTSTIDLAIGRTGSFISHITDRPGRVEFGSIPVGGVGTMVDYGNYGDGTTGELPSLGDKMGGYARRYVNNFNVYSESKYDFFDFNGIVSRDIEINVLGRNKSSGSPWYTSDGKLSGISVAATNSMVLGDTIVLELTLPEVQTWLQPQIDASWERYYASIPEPSSAALFGGTVVTLLGMRRRASNVA